VQPVETVYVVPFIYEIVTRSEEHKPRNVMRYAILLFVHECT